MDDVLMKGVGMWLLVIIESIIVFLAFWLGRLVNGLPIELFAMISTIMGASQVLIFLAIKKYFGITD